ncbi:ATP-binding cassette sub-family A member 3 [Araneus ventricosus]|uniref:ATP-binding cassette sub-family A member 3 n=1 Tax=Araneus ventricosus TaxID=182803 RepID=A0A4Y2F7F2_ARAVE|nr:ATP-binding cassette sub-family A member 3 [Araneus ventricosus]
MSPGKALQINIFSRFLALLYKELLHRKCHYIRTSFEVIFPIIIMSIPCMLYQRLPENFSQDRGAFKWINFTTFEPLDPMRMYSFVRTEDLEFVYAPSNEVTDQFMEDSIRAFFGGSYQNGIKIPKKMNSEEELRKYILEKQKVDEQKLMIGTVFKGFGATLPKDLDYKIYYMRNFDTDSKYVLNGPETFTGYRFSFFTQWQTAVGDTFLQKKSIEYNKNIDYKIFLQTFPYPKYKQTPNGGFVANHEEYFLHAALIFFVAAIVKRIVDEKNRGSKELMESMGMTKSSYWASHFTNNFITAFGFTLVIVIIYKTSTKNTEFHLQSDFIPLFIILLLFLANLILFCMTFSIFFNNVAYAVIAVMMVYLLSFQLLMWKLSARTLEEYFSFSLFHKLCICLYPSGGLLTSFLIMHLFENGNEGVQWGNLTEYPMVPDINMLMVILMMVLSCFFYIFAIWYFDTVWPWQPGVRKPFYFFLTRSYWFGETPVVPDEIELVRNENSADNVEEEPRNAVSSVVIKDLSKVVQRGSSSRLVLSDVSLKCYEGQIITLLGHSETGKTSLINILTGKELPTKGSVSVAGLDISTNRTRKLLGVCPQHNVLYDELSVEQHLKFYAAMKGTSLRQLTCEAEQVLNSLKLTSKKTEMVSNLSYADKRKLCLAIAIVGGSKVLLLDEPTYGMDAESKRHVWDALLAVKHDRTVIVTTQSCEEADILGDRIAVMAEGEIHGCGTPAFIKQKLGAGYHLHVLKDVNFDLQGLKSLITKHVSTATCENESYKEVSFNLGDASPASPRLVSLHQTRFGDLFEDLDSRKAELGIISYGVSLSTIRDVLST